MEELFNKTNDFIKEYLQEVNNRAVYPSPEALELMEQLPAELPVDGMNAEDVIEKLHEYGSPATVATNGSRYFGFVIGAAYPVAIAAKLLSTAWDQCAGLKVLSPIGSRLEEIAGDWLLDLFRLPPNQAVGFVTGATMANFTGLVTARYHLLKRAGWNVIENGLYGAPEIKVIVGGEVHVSVLKALSLAGLGSKRVIRVPVDDQGRIIASEIPEMDEMTIFCAQAGNVDSGAFDPLSDIGQICIRNKAWLHIDGAFGMWASASPEFQHLTNGAEMADSIAVDLHKWLNVPYDSGIIICKHTDSIRQAMSIHAGYIPKHVSREPYFYTQAMSRRARGVEAYATLLFLGKSGIASLVEKSCSLARQFAKELDLLGYEILNKVVLNQVVVDFGKDMNQIVEAIQSDGTCWVGGTTWKDKQAIRISISSYSTTEQDVIQSVRALDRIVKQLADFHEITTEF